MSDAVKDETSSALRAVGRASFSVTAANVAFAVVAAYDAELTGFADADAAADAAVFTETAGRNVSILEAVSFFAPGKEGGLILIVNT